MWWWGGGLQSEGSASDSASPMDRSGPSGARSREQCGAFLQRVRGEACAAATATRQGRPESACSGCRPNGAAGASVGARGASGARPGHGQLCVVGVDGQLGLTVAERGRAWRGVAESPAASVRLPFSGACARTGMHLELRRCSHDRGPRNASRFAEAGRAHPRDPTPTRPCRRRGHAGRVPQMCPRPSSTRRRPRGGGGRGRGAGVGADVTATAAAPGAVGRWLQ